MTWDIEKNLYGGCKEETAPPRETRLWKGRERKGKSLQAFGVVFWVNQDNISLSVFFSSCRISYFSEVIFYPG